MISIAWIIRAAVVAMQSLFLMFFVMIAKHRHAGKRAAASRAFERRLGHRFNQLKLSIGLPRIKHIGNY